MQLPPVDRAIHLARQREDRVPVRVGAERIRHADRWSKNMTNANWLVNFEYDEFTEDSRNTFMETMKELGIDSRPYFYPISDMPMYEKAETPVAHNIFSKGINLPSSCNLTFEEIKYICDSVQKALKIEFAF